MTLHYNSNRSQTTATSPSIFFQLLHTVIAHIVAGYIISEYKAMSDNVGLSTPRGSGTSGYVQKNLAHMKPRDRAAPYPKNTDYLPHKQRQPDQGILEHDRKREIEVKVFELRDKLEDDE